MMMMRQEKGLKLFPGIYKEIVWYFTLSKSEMKSWSSLIYIVLCDKWLFELTQEDNSCLRKNFFNGISFDFYLEFFVNFYTLNFFGN